MEKRQGLSRERSFLPYARQWIDREDIAQVAVTLKSDWITQGPKVEEFERRVADYCEARFAVAMSSGTAALHAACHAAGIKAGDEVITTPLTFVATANAVLYQKGVPVFADILEDTYTIDPIEIQRRITGKTRAILPVHFAGHPCDMEAIHELARRYHLVVIEDAAHALGAKYRERKVGGLSDMTVFSFHPVKHITTGEGGMVTTDNPDYYGKLIEFRSHGITRDRSRLSRDEGPWYYEMQDLGFNYRITDFQCALGIQQMTRLEAFIRRRREITERYRDGLQEMKEIALPVEKEDRYSSWHLFVIRLNPDRLKADRRDIFCALQKNHIGVNVHYLPVYLQPYYQGLGYRKGLCPRAEKYYDAAITLPLFPEMSDEEVNDVIYHVKAVIGDYRT